MPRSPSIDDASLDRLVDGELSPDERRDLLRALEAAPDGWRRCALAFVESQALGEQLGGLLAAPGDAAAEPRPSRGKSEPRPLQGGSATRAGSPVGPGRRGVAPWALAAAVLLAFGLGLAARGVTGPAAASPTMTTADKRAPMTPNPAAAEPADRAAPLDESLLVWATDGDGRRRAIRAPLVDADAVHRRFGVRFDAGPPPEVVRRFEEQGYRLSTRRRFAPLFVGGDASGGGQPIVVPVDDVRVVPVRNVAL